MATFDDWTVAHAAWRRPQMCPGCASRPAGPSGLCVACMGRLGHPPGVGRVGLARWHRPPPIAQGWTIEDPAVEELADWLAAWLATRPPACPRCAAPTATLEAEPCAACVAELEAEREALHVAEMARQRAWWRSYGPEWRESRRAAGKG